MEYSRIEDGGSQAPLFYAECRLHAYTVSVAVLDISASGCLIDNRGLNVHVSDRVLVKPPGLGPLPATVLWIWEEKAGLEFDHQLYEPVLAHLLGRRVK